MTFPEKRYDDGRSFASDYLARLREASASVDLAAIESAAAVLTQVHSQHGIIYSCGNGGSASIANHLVCDHCKGVQSDTRLRPRIYSLSSNIEIVTAVANDISYNEIFVYQLSSLARAGDALLAISSSGDSENIVRASLWARENGIPVIAMTGFSGGRSAVIADVSLHVEADNYGIIEDVHQSLMHILAQHIRQTHMDQAMIEKRKF